MSALGERLRTRASVITLPLFKAMGMSHSNFDRRFRCFDVLQGEISVLNCRHLVTSRRNATFCDAQHTEPGALFVFL
jgi:hypothetical protein